MTSLSYDAPKSEAASPEASSSSGRKKSQRPSWSCTECTRRKIRCDRIVPGCNQCVKRNKVHLCRLDQDEKIGFGPDDAEGAPLHEPEGQSRLASSSEFEAITRNIDAVRQRLYHLERVVGAFVPRPDVVDDAGQPSWGVNMNLLRTSRSSGHPSADGFVSAAPTPAGGATMHLPSFSGYEAHASVAGPSPVFALPPVTPSVAPQSLPPVQAYEPQPYSRYSSGTLDDDAEVEAATSLEYLALGRDSKEIHFSRAELRRPAADDEELLKPNAATVDRAAALEPADAPARQPPPAPLDDLEQASLAVGTCAPEPTPVPVSVIPPEETANAIISYSLERVGWQHGAVHAGQFRAECAEFASWGSSRADKVNQAWLALYLAVLCAGVKHMSADDARSCGLALEELRTLPKLFFNASVEALHRGRFLAKHSIYSVQTIVILVVACQDVGGSDLIATLLASGIRIAQHLKISRFGSDEEWEAKRRSSGVDPQSEQGIRGLIQREVRKRLWYTLATEDWLSVPFRRAYAIFPSHFTTPPPLNCHDEDLSAGVLINRPQDEPTCVSKLLIAHKVASCIRRFFEDVNSKPDRELSYELLLEVDREIRAIIDDGPAFLKADNDKVDKQPAWVRWMLHWWIMSVSHKLLMCHRVFLGRSFRDAKYIYSHKAAIEAARSIIQELVPYHTISAATTIILDIFQTSSSDPDLDNKRREVQSALGELRVLAAEGNSQIASRGIQLLTTLLAEEAKHRQPVDLRKRKAAEMAGGARGEHERFGDVAKRVVSNRHTALSGASSSFPLRPHPAIPLLSPTLAALTFPYFAPTLADGAPLPSSSFASPAAHLHPNSPHDSHISDASLTQDAFDSILQNLSGWSAGEADAFGEGDALDAAAAGKEPFGVEGGIGMVGSRWDHTGDFFRMLDAGSFDNIAAGGGGDGGFGALGGASAQTGQPAAVW
ncbi:hypothetical protein JCM10450v2_004998 [Rhodotorula kratochvilovae]